MPWWTGSCSYRNRPLTDAQQESNRRKSKIRARIEHVFGYMSQSMKGFYLRAIGRRRNAAAIKPIEELSGAIGRLTHPGEPGRKFLARQ